MKAIIKMLKISFELKISFHWALLFHKLKLDNASKA